MESTVTFGSFSACRSAITEQMWKDEDEQGPLWEASEPAEPQPNIKKSERQMMEIPICMEWKHSPATLMWYFGMFAECQDPGYSRETLKACLVLRLLLLAESDWAPRTYQEWQWSCGAEGEGQGLRSFQWTEEARIEKKTSWGRALVI